MPFAFGASSYSPAIPSTPISSEIASAAGIPTACDHDPKAPFAPNDQLPAEMPAGFDMSLMPASPSMRRMLRNTSQ